MFLAAKTSLARRTNGQNRMLYNRNWFSFNGGHSEPDLRCFCAVGIFSTNN
jgi:hypothetical protein